MLQKFTEKLYFVHYQGILLFTMKVIHKKLRGSTSPPCILISLYSMRSNNV